MSIHENISLKPYNTFGLDVQAAYFTAIDDISALKTILSDNSWQNIPKLILGEGSNILFTKPYPGLVIHNRIKGIELSHEDDNDVFLKVGAGENWHRFVMHCVNHNYGGIENLSLIPGTVGAAPVQNIGAYGVEIKDTLHTVHTLSIDGKTEQVLNNQDCQFDYRNSVFKNALKDKCVITHVTFRLKKDPLFHIEYGAIKQTLKEKNIKELTLKSISDAVIDIRQSKLPDPQFIGNAGSFFKNPIVDARKFQMLKFLHPEIPFYSVSDNIIKIPAAWLIEQAGFKGAKFGGAGVHDKQPLVLINHNGATGEEIFALSEQIKASVKDRFDITLNTEVNII